MKKTFIFIFFAIILKLNAQHYAEYTLTKKTEDKILTANCFLTVDRNTNVSNFEIQQFSNLLEQNDQKIANSQTFFNDTRKTCFDNKVYQYDFKKNKAYFELFDISCDTKRSISSELFAPKWALENKIYIKKGYKVKKATAFIGDRNWTVYYAYRIKSQYNPWQFTKLNGIIIEAEDEKQVYKFQLSKFQQNYSSITFQENYKYPVLQFEEFKKMATEKYWKNTFQYLSKLTSKPLHSFNINDFAPYETLEFIEKK